MTPINVKFDCITLMNKIYLSTRKFINLIAPLHRSIWNKTHFVIHQVCPKGHLWVKVALNARASAPPPYFT